MCVCVCVCVCVREREIEREREVASLGHYVLMSRVMCCHNVYRPEGEPQLLLQIIDKNSYRSACFFFGVLLQHLTHCLIALASGYLQGS